MNRLPAACVVDASAGIRLFLPEEHSEAVQELFEQSLEDADASLCVPDLFFIECANVLWKKVRRGEYSAQMAFENLADLKALDLPTTPSSELMERALQIACDLGITAYDACYAALAEARGVPLLTADNQLAAKVAGGVCEVVVLGEAE